MDIRELQLNEAELNNHWYFRSKAGYLLRAVGKEAPDSILDVGAGSGFFSRWLLRHTDARRATCLDTGYGEEWEETFSGKQIIYRTRPGDTMVDLVLMMDVLEHVDDDAGLLRHYVNLVPPGTLFILTVPAFSFLWSSHDVFLQHKRRYTITSLTRLVDAAGLECEVSYYGFGLVFPIACMTRLFDRLFLRKENVVKSTLKKHSRPVNLILRTLCLLEEPLVRLNKLAGLSVFCRGRKPLEKM